MAQTVNSSALCYCSAADVFARCDIRVVADLVSDTGARATGTTPDPNALATNANLLALMGDATGEIEAAATVGARYDPLDLQAILQSSPPAAGSNYLRALCASLVVGKLFDRRPDSRRPRPKHAEAAEETLKLLREGQRVFPFLNTQQAGLVAHSVESPATVEDRDMTTFKADRFFGRRSDRSDPTGLNES